METLGLRSLHTFGVDSPYTPWRVKLKNFLKKNVLGSTWTCTCRPFSWQKWDFVCLILTNWLNEFTFWVWQTGPGGHLIKVIEPLFQFQTPSSESRPPKLRVRYHSLGGLDSLLGVWNLKKMALLCLSEGLQDQFATPRRKIHSASLSE